MRGNRRTGGHQRNGGWERESHSFRKQDCKRQDIAVMRDRRDEVIHRLQLSQIRFVRQKRWNQYKQKPGVSDGTRPASARMRVSQEDFLGRGRKTAACTRSLSDPVRAGASKNQGAFRLKLRLEPPFGLMVARFGRTLTTCLSQVPRGEVRYVTSP